MKKNTVNMSAIRKILSVIMAFCILVVTSFISVYADDTTNYLCITALENGVSVTLKKVGSPTIVNLEIKKNNGSWETYAIGNQINLNKGECVYYRNTSTTTTGFSKRGVYYHFDISNKVSISGDVTTLINKNGTTTLIEKECFANLFSDNNSIVYLSESLLPATTLTEGCYYEMFFGCDSLSSLPLLPATTLPSECYMRMFTNSVTRTNLIISDTQSDANFIEYKIPSNGALPNDFDVTSIERMFENEPFNLPTLGINGVYTIYLKPIGPFFVVYDGNGYTGGSVPIDDNLYNTSGEEVTVLDKGTLSKDGAIFKGWNTKADGSGTFYQKDEKFNITNTTILYAIWNYSVIYDGNGNTDGTVPTDSNIYNYGDNVTVLGNTGSLVKTNQAFKGWNTKADGSGTLYIPSDKFNITNSTTLYAIWGDYAFTADSGIGAVSGDKKYVKKSLIDLLFTCDGPKDECQKVSVDGTILTEGSEYTIASGSTKITLKGSYLETLALGNHTIKLTYINGQEPTMTFSVVENNGSSNKNSAVENNGPSNKNGNAKLFSVPNTGVY